MRYDEEQGTDRLLEALGSVKPPAGMQDRILHRLAEQERAAVPHAAAGFGLWWPWLAGGLALATLGLAAAFLYHPAAPPTAAVAHVTSPTFLPPKREAPRPSLAPKRHAARNSESPHQAASAQGTPPQPHELASFPAPESPLTQQEKLLLGIARHPGPGDLALLNPEKREEIAQISRADFNQFFPQPLPQEKFYELQNKDR
jgi:hypothetical protein